MGRKEEVEELELNEFNDADAHVSRWIEGIGKLDKNYLRIYFEGCEAKEPSAESRKKLAFKHYGQLQRSAVMKEIWGDKYDKFKKWVADVYIPDAEARGLKLFHLKDKPDTKSEGMVSFFADMTALAFATEGDYTFENFDLVTSTRIASYEKHIQGGWKKEDFQIQIPGYNNDKPFAPASFPSDFPAKAIEQIRTWSTIS